MQSHCHLNWDQYSVNIGSRLRHSDDPNYRTTAINEYISREKNNVDFNTDSTILQGNSLQSSEHEPHKKNLFKMCTWGKKKGLL